MSAPRYAYIISKNLDPVFALSVGVAAAGTRINREQKEKGYNPQQTMEALQRRIRKAMGMDGGFKDS
ncbi:hypothetical protein H2203_006582 [Taxawa tesnikishii (nom. ined.)]|nr:hypothetical protein H2203_006582 [Dothideales sp. JES 119]